MIKVDLVTGKLSVEGITSTKADGKQKEYYVDIGHIVITKLDFSRQERLNRIREIAALKKITIVEPTPEEMTTAPEETSAVEEATPVEAEPVTEESETAENAEEADAGSEETEEAQEEEEESEDDQ